MKYRKIYAAECRKALKSLLDYFNGSKAQASRVLKVHYQAVNAWHKAGRVGANTAWRIDSMPEIPFTKEELRPDIKDWSVYSRNDPVIERTSDSQDVLPDGSVLRARPTGC